MPRRDDDFDDDDRPRRRRPDDEDDDRPSRSRSRHDDVPRPKKKKSHLGLILGIIGGVFLLCCGGGGFAIFYFGDKFGTEVRDRRDSADNLKQVGLAFHAHHDRVGTLPSNSYDANGRPLLSWRVHLLPDLGEKALYDQFHKDEPWDGPNNRRLVSQMPRVYTTDESRVRAGEGKTYYRGFSHQGAIFERPARPGIQNQVRLALISDGLFNTILVVEAGDPVEWTRPDDLDWSPGRPMPALGAGRKGDEVFALMGDGSVRSFRKTMAEPTWRALITYNGNEIVNPD